MRITLFSVALLPLTLAACTPGGGGSTSPEEAAFCGGIAGIQCPNGYTCVDDPTDTCDPKSGGADCGGICITNEEAEDPMR